MTNPPDEPPPDWSLLPHDPAAFFGLSDPIDRKDLKRAYNRLLRRFKPEKAPAEFQRIRAAYEALDERLRYGNQTGPVPPHAVKWEETTSEASDTSREPVGRRSSRVDRTPIPKQKPLAERLETESPESLYRELAAIEQKNPFEYYALAVLSDVVEKGKPLRFVEWLLSALKTHPDEGALWRLLHEYVRGPLPRGAEEKLLPAIAKVARGDFFYPLTEPLWLALLRQGQGAEAVERFAKLLEQCQRELRDEQISGRLAFSIQLAKAALLVGDHPWPHEAIDYIEANFEQVPPWFEGDLDMLGLLREYARVRERFAAGCPLRRQIDDALRTYFLEDQQQGDSAVVAAQVAIAGDSAALAAAFPLDENDLFSPFFPLWCWVSWDVGERNAPRVEPTGPRPNWHGRVREILVRLNNDTNSSWAGVKWSAAGLLFRIVQTVVVALVVIVSFAIPIVFLHDHKTETPPAYSLWVAIACAIAGAYGGWKLKEILEEKYWNDYCQRASAKLYQRDWRPAIIQFQHRSHLDGDEFRALFANSVYSDLSLSGYINAYVQQDYAPALLAVALRFLA